MHISPTQLSQEGLQPARHTERQPAMQHAQLYKPTSQRRSSYSASTSSPTAGDQVVSRTVHVTHSIHFCAPLCQRDLPGGLLQRVATAVQLPKVCRRFAAAKDLRLLCSCQNT
jgi:hypothetical protein